ncbi:CBS domain pair protein [Synechococcus sp. PCC 7335]|uniref:histidine kinase dimerization/phospho-acceptor domain-containing protein n=1 Tax=Synechococcus sp. (strain ATCC 29403 / PCC 7335) TaxID=91464 RepID=UPI00017EB53B|nr:histidine kinase dimerization/phospho-acceptor domain-containing protein [Synechococcus sp. PCC 7335]EDX83188.1 CBS domain pair protein [Synechococcus sp. PCC 7335]
MKTGSPTPPSDIPLSDSTPASLISQVVIPVSLTLAPETLIEEAIAYMHKADHSCVLITHQQRLVGMFTERELIRLINTGQHAASQPISEVMVREVETIRAADIKDVLSILQKMEHGQLRYLPVVGEIGELAGMITQDSLLNVINPNEVEQMSGLNEPLQIEARRTRVQAERCWCTLLDNVQLMVIGLDSRGKVTYANPFFLQRTGYTTSEVVDADWLSCCFSSTESPEIIGYFHQLQNHENHEQYRELPLQYENTILTKAGEERTVVWNNTLLHDYEDKVVGTISIGEDITDRSAIERMKGEFIATVSHELRTPLTAIHGGIKLLSRGTISSQSDQGRNLIQLVERNSQRLIKVVNDILELEN